MKTLLIWNCGKGTGMKNVYTTPFIINCLLSLLIFFSQTGNMDIIGNMLQWSMRNVHKLVLKQY